MEDLKTVIATNITDLRKSQNLTQADLAARLNYSDKSVSKWERGESLPDIGVLKQIADMFDVTVDYLLQENVSPEQEQLRQAREKRQNQTIISLLAVSAVWIAVTVIYVYAMVYVGGVNLWRLFVWAMPISALVGLFCNRFWGNRRVKFWLLTLLTWSTLATVFVQTLEYVHLPWPLFFAGIPVQLALILWSKISIEPGEKWFPRKSKDTEE